MRVDFLILLFGFWELSSSYQASRQVPLPTMTSTPHMFHGWLKEQNEYQTYIFLQFLNLLLTYLRSSETSVSAGKSCGCGS